MKAVMIAILAAWAQKKIVPPLATPARAVEYDSDQRAGKAAANQIYVDNGAGAYVGLLIVLGEYLPKIKFNGFLGIQQIYISAIQH